MNSTYVKGALQSHEIYIGQYVIIFTPIYLLLAYYIVIYRHLYHYIYLIIFIYNDLCIYVCIYSLINITE